MRIQAITPSVGAEITDVDLRSIDDEAFAKIHEAFLAHGVLVFRDQTFDPESHLTFARRFGDIDVYPFTSGNRHFAPHPDGIEGVVRLEHDETKPGYENQWHIDMTWRAEPPLGSILRAVELPPSGGGDTMFCSLGAVYESLSHEVQQFLQPLTQTHDWLRTFGRGMTVDQLATFRADLPTVHHPAIRTHPETGRKGLFVNQAFGISLSGVDAKQAEYWLQHLYGLIATPEFQCRVKWAPGTVVMCDNPAIAHYAVNDYYPERRVMERVTIAGDKPF